MFAPLSISPKTKPSFSVTFSHGITAVAPSGITPPVAIARHSDFPICCSDFLPVVTSQITFHGESPDIANPSIDDVSKAGRSQSDV